MDTKCISDFLDFCDEMARLANTAYHNLQFADNQTQDILHKLELETVTYHEYARLAKSLAEIRRERRVSKDLYDMTHLVLKWVRNNYNPISQLRTLITDIQDLEKSTERRFYRPRTTIIGEQNIIGNATTIAADDCTDENNNSHLR